MTRSLRGSSRVGARSIGRALAVLCLLLVFVGCGTYADRSRKIRESVESGNLDKAMGLVPVDESTTDVLDLLERGLLLLYAGQPVEAAKLFDRANTRIEDLYTKSVSREALAFLTNDATLDYTGYPAEQVLLHTYAALAYLEHGDLQSALVEARRASGRLQALEELREDKKGYSDDAFAEWIAAMLYAEDDDANSCLVSCRRALAAFDEARELFGLAVPAEFVRDYTVWARRYGFGEEAVALEERFGTIAEDAREPLPGYGEVVLVYESGWVDRLEESRVDFPILENDDDDDDYARRVYMRGGRRHYVVRDDVEVKYWLSVALPYVKSQPTTLVDARMIVGDLATHTEPVHDVSGIFRLTFEEGSANRTIRTIARGIAKYLAVQVVKNEREKDGKKVENEVAGFLANLFASATERADTRSWTMLPDRIHLARLAVPAGTHTIEVEVLDGSGRVGQRATFEAVTVRAGQRTVLHHRSYR